MLKREDITRERIESLISEARKFGKFDALTHEERENNRHQFFQGKDLSKGVWVFGYGSLIWNPAFHFLRRKTALVHGFHRRFCLHLTIGRGSPEHPGLMLALDRGGSCKGIAFEIGPDEIESETEILWMREMISGAYQPKWIKMRTEDGTLEGFTFVVNREHKRYRGDTDLRETAQALKRGEGPLGTCQEYLFNTVSDLATIGIKDQYLDHLLDEISQLEDQT